MGHEGEVGLHSLGLLPPGLDLGAVTAVWRGLGEHMAAQVPVSVQTHMGDRKRHGSLPTRSVLAPVPVCFLVHLSCWNF